VKVRMLQASSLLPRRAIEDEDLQIGYEKLMAALRNQPELQKEVEVERHGGPCMLCGKPWKVVSVNNNYGKFAFWQPNCTCFQICHTCSMPQYTDLEGVVHPEIPKYLVAERLLSLDHCTGCNPPRPKPPKRKRPVHDAKSAAAGEEVEL
jgi:hypothetical protein